LKKPLIRNDVDTNSFPLNYALNANFVLNEYSNLSKTIYALATVKYFYKNIKYPNFQRIFFNRKYVLFIENCLELN